MRVAVRATTRKARAAGALALLSTVAALAPAGCGNDDGAGAAGSDRLVISAAASLGEPLRACAPDGAKLSFAGSDELAAQIRQGVKPGVFAAANTTLPAQLHDEGLAQPPRTFATNELVIAVGTESNVRRVEDLARRDTTLVVGADSVPVGAYTRDVLGRLPGAVRQAIEANVRSREPDVKGVVGKVAQGAADAGFVYATDVTAAGERLRAIHLPRALRPQVAYAATVVARSDAAERYLDGLVGGECQRALRKAGFGAP